MPQYIKPGDVDEGFEPDGCEIYNARNINITRVNTDKLNDAMFDALYPDADAEYRDARLFERGLQIPNPTQR